MPTDARSAEVQKALVNSASQFARHAIDAYLDEHYEVFLMHAATASEHLLKASLCGRSVALIAQAAREREHFRSLIAPTVPAWLYVARRWHADARGGMISGCSEGER